MGVKKAPVFLILISLLLPVQLFAGGNPEKGLPKVDRLIKDKNYNEAILELTIYMNENPEDFDGAQRRIRRIIKLRDTYNAKGMELLSVLTNEPTNDQKKLEMIAYMESLEKNPNQATRDFILGTKAAAQFTYYRAKFDEIMLSGDTLIDQGLYVEAARKFVEGYIFYKQEFDDETGAELLGKVNESLASIDSAVISFSDIQVSFNTAVEACKTAVSSGDIEMSESAFALLDTEMVRFSRLRNLVADSGWFFQDTFAGIQKENSLITESSFLPFAYRFTLGRKGTTRYEGVLGAMDIQWNTAVDQINALNDETIRTQWLTSYSALDAGSAENGIALLEKTRRFTVLARNLSSSISRFPVRPDTFGIRDYRTAVSRYSAFETLTAEFLTTANQYRLYQELKNRMVSYTGQLPLAEYLRKAPSSTVLAYSGFASELDAFIRKTESTPPVFASPGNTATDVISLYIQELTAFRQKFSSFLVADFFDMHRKSASFQENAATGIVREWQVVNSEAAGLLDGITTTTSAAVFYPSESIVVFNKLRTGIISDRKAILDSVVILKNVADSIRADTQYSLSVTNMESAIALLDSLNTEAASAIARANSRILQANLARQESDLRFLQAQSALKKSDFQSARDNLQRSRDKINQSLVLQESVSLRTSSDIKIEKLGLEITRLENESVVREVRTLISAGKNFYYIGNFDQAEQILVQAKTRWGATNIEANPEITNWIEIVNTALSMKTGRAIPVSAPLYPQMSQILSSVNQLFSEGRALLDEAKKTEAIAVLTSAKVKLQQLQLVYPINQDAGQLTLRIDQLIDPAAFNTFFRQKVESVRANYKTEKQSAYSDLLDLYQINPKYPGIKNLVDEVEIYLGIQIPPPDPKALARSLELTRASQKIYDANTRSMFPVALNQLDEAIKLNPDNQAAITLKDRLQTSGGGQSVAVLSGDDEAKYQRAVQELQKGNKLIANALVDELLLNPKSKNSSKIQDLKKRIESQR